MEDFMVIITNWVVGTLSTALAVSFVVVGLCLIAIASLKMFNTMIKYMNAEFVKARNTVIAAREER